MILVKDIFGRSYLETRSEYRLAMALAMEGARRGNLLDFSGVRSRAGLGSPVYAGYKNYLIETNLVRGATVKESDFYPYDSGKDCSYLDKPNLFEDNGDYLYWDESYGLETLGSLYYSLSGVLDMQYFLAGLVAKHWMDYLLGIETRCLYIKCSIQLSKTISSYIDIESVRQSFPEFSKIVKIVLNESSNIDLKLTLFQYDAQHLGFNKEYSVEEKLSLMDQLGFKEGMILILYDRAGINTSNSLGRIDAAHVVRLDEVVNGKMYLSYLRATRTYEETAKDFEMIPEKNRHLYYDLLEAHDSLYDSTVVELRECGIGNHFFREKYLIDSISTVDKVKKLVSPRGVVIEEELSEADAIYYTLMQNDSPINSKLFRDYYFGGKEGYWDVHKGNNIEKPADFLSEGLDF